MTAQVIGGPTSVGLQQTEEGQRIYKVTHRVIVDDIGDSSSIGDGPYIASLASGLPTIGSEWAFGNDYDPWAFCTPKKTVTPDPQHQGKGGNTEKARFYLVTQEFSTIANKRCQDESFEDPLLEPQKVSGGFIRKRTQAMFNYDGSVIKSSSHELYRGASVEFDDDDNFVHIEQNVPNLELPLISGMRRSVNSVSMWGMAPRTIRLTGFNWQMKFYGTCQYYFTRMFDFEVRDETWDRTLLDEGTKVLHGEWKCIDGRWQWVVTAFPEGDCNDATTPDASNPSHFVRYKDVNGENCTAILDGAGLPFDGSEPGTGTGTGGSPGTVDVAYYRPANYFSLGIPADITVPTIYGA